MNESIIKTGKYHFKDYVKDPEKYERVHPERPFKTREDLTPEDFSTHLIQSAVKGIYPRRKPFLVDERNRDCIAQMYYFLVGDKENFKGDLWKGFMLVGPYGSGKTLLLKSFMNAFKIFTYNESDYFNGFSREREKPIKVEFLSSRNILETSSNGVAEFTIFKTRNPLFIDDVGKEPGSVNNYGTVTKPMEDVLEFRYSIRALTFGTSNHRLEDMPYSGHTRDRMKSLFNFIKLTGDSRRI